MLEVRVPHEIIEPVTDIATVDVMSNCDICPLWSVVWDRYSVPFKLDTISYMKFIDPECTFVNPLAYLLISLNIAFADFHEILDPSANVPSWRLQRRKLISEADALVLIIHSAKIKLA